MSEAALREGMWDRHLSEAISSDGSYRDIAQSLYPTIEQQVGRPYRTVKHFDANYYNKTREDHGLPSLDPALAPKASDTPAKTLPAKKSSSSTKQQGNLTGEEIA